jgi:hypothetical protein
MTWIRHGFYSFKMLNPYLIRVIRAPFFMRKPNSTRVTLTLDSDESCFECILLVK